MLRSLEGAFSEFYIYVYIHVHVCMYVYASHNKSGTVPTSSSRFHKEALPAHTYTPPFPYERLSVVFVSACVCQHASACAGEGRYCCSFFPRLDFFFLSLTLFRDEHSTAERSSKQENAVGALDIAHDGYTT
jgi:hypothetical protein